MGKRYSRLCDTHHSEILVPACNRVDQKVTSMAHVHAALFRNVKYMIMTNANTLHVATAPQGGSYRWPGGMGDKCTSNRARTSSVHDSQFLLLPPGIVCGPRGFRAGPSVALWVVRHATIAVGTIIRPDRVTDDPVCFFRVENLGLFIDVRRACINWGASIDKASVDIRLIPRPSHGDAPAACNRAAEVQSRSAGDKLMNASLRARLHNC